MMIRLRTLGASTHVKCALILDTARQERRVGRMQARQARE